MRQNAQQHDTGIDVLVLQMLLPLHSLKLLLSHWDAAATTLFASALLPLVLADAAAATFLTAAPPPLVLTDAADNTALHSFPCHCCSCSPLHKCTLSPRPLPTHAHTVFGGWGAATERFSAQLRAHCSGPEVCRIGECIVCA